jgi:aryl-alcohol dehydrogenase-like predicted oxidoreductase
MQLHLNLLYREEEREMLPLCEDQGIGVIPWSPLARGLLARPWSDEPITERSKTDAFGKALYDKTKQADRAVIDAVGTVAEQIGAARSEVALAWLLAKPEVCAPIIGVTKPAQLDSALKALDVTLDAQAIGTLEEHYVPHAKLSL